MSEHPDRRDDSREPGTTRTGEQTRWYASPGAAWQRPSSPWGEQAGHEGTGARQGQHGRPGQQGWPHGGQPGQQGGPGPGPNEPTAPQWYGNTGPYSGGWGGAGQDPRYGSGGPSGPTGPTGGGGGGGGKGKGSSSGRSRWLAVPVAAVLAAALASGGTYAVVHDDSASAAPTSSNQTQEGNSQSAPPVTTAADAAPNWTAVADKVSPSVVAITVTNGRGGAQGSGVILDGEGRIVTNNHVVSGLGPDVRLRVTLNNSRTYTAHVVGTDSLTDLAVIQIDNPPDDLQPVHLASDNSLKVGQPVMAIGNPLGLAGTVTTGIVSALDRPVTTQQQGGGGSPANPFSGNNQRPVVTNAVQTSAAINPGNSGGALVDASGSLVGINSSIATVGQSMGGESGNIGIGFVIPVSEVKTITEQLIKDGHAEHAYMGVYLKDTRVKIGSATREAAGVTRVVNGTPADKAGLEKGDAIIAIDGESVNSILSLQAQVNERSVGESATLTVVRNGQKQQVDITFGSSPNG
ncbi:MAG TPA: trypsin-like peptidase domain-containing protein [Segeticoccus sp.]|nr:trypsin-like peptidase domain-containing protein [Segeticoccus sp.]